jgi:type II secretory pathway component PulF
MAILYPPGDTPLMMMAIVAIAILVLAFILVPEIPEMLRSAKNVPQGQLFVNNECKLTIYV